MFCTFAIQFLKLVHLRFPTLDRKFSTSMKRYFYVLYRTGFVTRSFVAPNSKLKKVVFEKPCKLKSFLFSQASLTFGGPERYPQGYFRRKETSDSNSVLLVSTSEH